MRPRTHTRAHAHAMLQAMVIAYGWLWSMLLAAIGCYEEAALLALAVVLVFVHFRDPWCFWLGM